MMRVSGSIRTKSIAVTVAVVTACIAVTTIHVGHRQIDERSAMSLQACSAAAFRDQATSHVGDRGERLYERGAEHAA